jgi:hypothetical protein
LITYINEDREAAWRMVAPMLEALPMRRKVVAARCLVGPVAECLEKLHRFVEAGCVKLVLRPCPPAEVAELYGTKTLPQFV